MPVDAIYKSEQQDAFERADKAGHRFHLAKDHFAPKSAAITKKHFSRRSPHEYMDEFHGQSGTLCHYEVLRDGRAVKLYLDAECLRGEDFTWTEAQLSDKALSYVNAGLRRLNLPECTAGDFAVQSASRGDKWSEHFTCNKYVFRSTHDAYRFFKAIEAEVRNASDWQWVKATKDEFVMEPIIDFKVYTKNRPMRMLGNDKLKVAADKKSAAPAGRPLKELPEQGTAWKWTDYLVSYLPEQAGRAVLGSSFD